MSTRTVPAPETLRDASRALWERRERLKRPLLSLVAALAAGTLALAVGAVTLVPAVFRSVGAIANVNVAMPREVTLGALAERSVVYAADGSELAVLHDEIDRRIVPLDEVPDHVRDAVLAAEDQKFWQHRGYDPEGIVRATVANLKAGEVEQGGSTITQQLAKTMVGSDRTIQRKLNELTYAMALERRYRKAELLHRYLNQVYFGAGAYGIAAAAEEYFHKEVGELTPAEGALLAGVIRSPSRLDPRRFPERVVARRDDVLRDMERLGFIEPEVARRALGAPLTVQPHRDRQVQEPYFVEAVKREFFANPAFGTTRDERINLLFSGGLKIHTTLRPDLQRAADELIRDYLPRGRPTAAIASVDPRDGRIVALASGIKFTEEQYDLAAQGRRQPGSAFKPFVLAAALDAGFPLSMRLAGSGPISIKMPDAQKPWKVDNYGGGDYGDLTLREGLVRSVNTLFAQLVMIVGPDEAARMATRLGIDFRAAMGGHAPVPAIALGGLNRGVTPLEMAAAYGIFATGGQRVTPHVIERVVNRQGEELWRAETKQRTVLEPAVAGAMIETMRDVVRRGTGTAARLRGWPAAGKTGTTQLNTDAWFVGYTPVLSTAVWMGHPEGQIRMGRVTGGSIPARIWQRFMTRALEGVEPVEFPETPPLSTIVGTGMTEVPDVVGMDATEALRTLAERGLVGVVRSVHTTIRPGKVLTQSPADGREVRRGTQVTIRVSTGSSAPRATPTASVSISSSPTPTTTSSSSPLPTPTATAQPEPTTEPSPTATASEPDPEPSPSPTRRRRRTTSPSPSPDPTVEAEADSTNPQPATAPTTTSTPTPVE